VRDAVLRHRIANALSRLSQSDIAEELMAFLSTPATVSAPARSYR
jgi:hypothetical protein